MRNMVLPLLYNEIAKTSRMKLPYLGIFAVLLVCLLVFAVTEEMVGGETLSAWGYTGLSMQSVFIDVGLICVAIFAAMLIAEERDSGTVRAVLASGVLRWEFYTAKVLMGLVYMVAISVFALAVSISFGALKYEFGDVADSAGLVYGTKQVLANFVLAYFLSWVPLISVVLFGVFASAIAKKSGQAVAVVVGLIILTATIKHLIGIGPYVFTTYLGSSWGIFHEVAQGVDYQWLPDIWGMVIVSVIYSVVSFTAGLAIFAKTDLNG